MPILGLKSIAKEYQTARSRKLLRVPCQKVFHKKHFKMFSIPDTLGWPLLLRKPDSHRKDTSCWLRSVWAAGGQHYFLSFSSNSPPTTSSMKPPCLLRPGSRQLTINFPTDLGVVVAV